MSRPADPIESKHADFGHAMNALGSIDDLKAVPIASVAAALNIRVPANGRGRCPLPGHEDRNPSFAIRPATNSFRCYACGRHGSVIDFVMEIEQLNFADACRWLRERFGNGSAQTRLGKRRLVAPRPSTQSLRGVDAAGTDIAFDDEVFGWLLEHSPLRSGGRSYLAQRGLSDATIESFRIGQIGDRASLMRDACRTFGEDRLKRCGVVADGRSGSRLIFPSGYILFPFIERDAVRYLQARRPDGETAYRWFCPATLPPPAFNLDALETASRSILICEGVTDVLSAAEMGKDAIGLLGANSQLDPAIIMKLKRRNVIVVGDADPPGQKFARNLVNLLSSRGITAVSRLPPAGANDLNAYLQSSRGRPS
jgi:DNA primase